MILDNMKVEYNNDNRPKPVGNKELTDKILSLIGENKAI